MPPKQAPMSGYTLFCQREVIPYFEQLEGRSMNMKEATDKGSQWYAEMDQSDKEYWKNEAKAYKTTDEWRDQKKTYRERVLREKERAPPSTIGKAKEKRRLAMEAEEEERKVHPYYGDTDVELLERKRDRDLQEITDDILWHEPGNAPPEEKRRWICARHWHMLSVIPYFEREYDRAFAPAELVLIEFNMEDGIENVDNWLIAHGIEDFEEGLFSQALRRSDLHKINVSQSKENVGSLGLRMDYDVIYKEIVQKTKGDKFVFVYSEDYNAVQGCLDFLRVNAMQMNSRVTVLPHSRITFIEDLIKVLAVHRNFKIDNQELELECRPEAWSSFDLNRETLCAYHYNIQCKVCAEATAKKILYYLFDKTSEQYQYVLGSGHLPDNVEVANCDDLVDLFGPIGTENGHAQAAASSAFVSANSKHSFSSRPIQDYDDESGNDDFARDLNAELSTLAINESQRPLPAGRGRGFLDDDDDLPLPGIKYYGKKAPISKGIPFGPQEIAFPLAPPFANAPVAQHKAMEATSEHGEMHDISGARALEVNAPNHLSAFKQVTQNKPITLPPSALLKNGGMKISPRINDVHDASIISVSSTIAGSRPSLAMRGLGRGMTTGVRPQNPGGKV